MPLPPPCFRSALSCSCTRDRSLAAWWRGRHPDGNAKRWRYALWDCDASFGHYINYTGIPDTGPTADPCNPESMGNIGGQGHIPVLNALMGNEDFFALYVNRWADLGNTHFTCENMHAVLDSMVMVIEPEMQKQSTILMKLVCTVLDKSK